MRAGAARDRLRFERKTQPTGGYINSAGAWVELITVHAEVAAQDMTAGDEREIAGKVRGVSDFRITVRDCAALASLTTADRAVNARSGAVYDLRHIDRKTGRADLIILADTGTPSNGG